MVVGSGEGSALDKPALMVPKEQSLETLLMSLGDATVDDARHCFWCHLFVAFLVSSRFRTFFMAQEGDPKSGGGWVPVSTEHCRCPILIWMSRVL